MVALRQDQQKFDEHGKGWKIVSGGEVFEVDQSVEVAQTLTRFLDGIHVSDLNGNQLTTKLFGQFLLSLKGFKDIGVHSIGSIGPSIALMDYDHQVKLMYFMHRTIVKKKELFKSLIRRWGIIDVYNQAVSNGLNILWSKGGDEGDLVTEEEMFDTDIERILETFEL